MEDFKLIPDELLKADTDTLEKYYLKLNKGNTQIKIKISYLPYYYNYFENCSWKYFPFFNSTLVRFVDGNVQNAKTAQQSFNESMNYYKISSWEMFLYNPHFDIKKKCTDKSKTEKLLIDNYIDDYYKNLTKFSNANNMFAIQADMMYNPVKVIGLLTGLAEMDKKHTKKFSVRKRFICYYIETYVRTRGVSFSKCLRAFVKQYYPYINDLIKLPDYTDDRNYSTNDGAEFASFYNDILEYRNKREIKK